MPNPPATPAKPATGNADAATMSRALECPGVNAPCLTGRERISSVYGPRGAVLEQLGNHLLGLGLLFAS
jgi:hypothetical protein